MNFDLFEKRSCFKFVKEDHKCLVSNGSGLVLDKESTKELIKMLSASVECEDWNEIDLYNTNREIQNKKEAEESNNFGVGDKKKLSGFIYFIKDNHNNVKIGRTKNIKSRIGEYTKLAFSPIVLKILESEDTVSDEQYYHDMFFDKRVRGEWFELNESDFEYILSL